MPTTKSKSSQADHDEFLKGMSKQDRLMHVAAGGLALHRKLTEVVADIEEAAEHRGSGIRGMQVAIPASILFGMSEVMGEMVNVLKEHKIVTQEQMEKFIEQKTAEAKAAEAKQPEGWCEACQTVHDHSDEHEGESVSGIAGAIAALMQAALAAHARRTGTQEEETSVPPDVTVH